MKKILFAFLCVLGICSLASCGDETTKGPSAKKTVIQYCGWDVGTEEKPSLIRKMIEKYNEASDTVRIEIVTHQGDYDTFLNTLASGQALPDIFMAKSVPNAVINELACDITSLAEADPEWVNVEQSLKDAITYNDKVYAIPSAQHYLGFFANYDLINDYAYIDGDAEDIFAPGAFGVDAFFNAIKDVKEINDNGTSVIGVNSTGDMINWLPSILDESGNIRHFVWNGSHFDFTSEVMINALTKIQEIGAYNAKFTFNSFIDSTQEEDPRIAKFGGVDENVVFENGQMAFLQGATYYSFAEPDFNYKFVGYPDGRVVSTGDFLCISNASKNKELAFEIAKYFSYGAEGINTMYEIVEENDDLVLTGLPINTDVNLTSKWFEYATTPGVKEVYEKVSKGEIEVLVEGLKPTPGFQNARFDYNTGITIEGVRNGDALKIGDFIWDVCEGRISIGQYTSNMTQARADLINKEIYDAFAKISKLQ